MAIRFIWDDQQPNWLVGMWEPLLSDEDAAMFGKIVAKDVALTACIRYANFRVEDTYLETTDHGIVLKWIKVRAVQQHKRRFHDFPIPLLGRLFYDNPTRLKVWIDYVREEMWARAIAV